MEQDDYITDPIVLDVQIQKYNQTSNEKKYRKEKESISKAISELVDPMKDVRYERTLKESIDKITDKL